MDNGASSYRRFLDGDEDAFDGIMKELFHNLVFFINCYVHDVHTAEDIAIDAMTDLIVHKHRYNFKVTLKTYLFMIGRSRAIDYIKHRSVINFVELSEAQDISDDERLLEKMIISDERRRAVNEAISKLPDNMRAAVHMIYFENMTYDEAAKVLHKNRKQVDNILYNARRKLKFLLKEYEEM